MKETKAFDINILRIIALTTSIIGAVGSLYFMFNASRNQNSILLIILFTSWVLSPFVGLFFAIKISNRWKINSRKLFYWLTIILTIGSLIAYSGVLTPPKTKLTFLFLLVPLISLLAIIILSRRGFRNKTPQNIEL